MSSSVDDRVVVMKFDNSQFGAGVSATLGMLQKLKSALAFNDGMRSFGTSIEGINTKLLAMGTIGVTALANITNKAISTGTQMVKALTVNPISSGLGEYETNLNSIQTILANTQASGATLGDVNKALQDLNTYSDKTIYNFSEMARNIGTFTAAGVDLKTSTESIKGIANLAALSGSNSQQAATAMYQLSQAISSGKVQLMDWNSVVNAGMGGTVFQRALAQTAVQIGTLDENAVKLTGKMKNVSIAGNSFRDSLAAKPGEESWLTTDVLTKTLQQFTGDLSDAELKAQGFNAEQIKAIQAQAKTAQDAATQVKTLSQVFDVAKETVGSGWAQTFQLIFGDFKEAKSSFTQLSNFVNGIINGMSKRRNEVLKGWRDLGGRDVLIEGIKAVGNTIGEVLFPLKNAFHDVFPPTTGASLFALTVKFRDFFQGLRQNEKTMDNLRRTFRGFFAIVDIGVQIVKGFYHATGEIFKSIGDGSGDFLEFTGNIGDWLVSLDEAIKKGGGLTKFFEGLGKILALPIKLISALAGGLNTIFSDETTANFDGASDAVGRFGDRLNPFTGLLHTLNKAWDHFLDALGSVGDLIAKVGPAIGKALSGIGDAIANNMSGQNFDRVLDTINTGLLAGITLLIKRFFDNGVKVDLGQLGFMEKVGGIMDGLTDHMNAMTQQVKAKTLLTIAGAIGILTASVVVLSLIDSEALTRALTAMAAGFAQLLIGMGILTKMAGIQGFLKLPAAAAGLVLMATALLILSAAVKVFSTMSWEEIGKGLAGVAGALTILSLAIIPLSKAQGPMIRSAVAIGILGGALILIATAMKIFATLNWEEMGKGLTGVVGSLTAIAIAMQLMPKGMVLQAAGLIAVGAALNLIGGALKIFATMSWKEIGKGITVLAGGLLVIAGAMQLMPASMILTGPALLAVAAAISVLAGALKIMATMSWEEIGKGLVTLGGALVILAAGLTAMSGALPGAAALVVAAGGLAILTPVLIALGAMSWESIIKGLTTLAASFVVLGVAAVVLTPVIGVLAALGAVVALIGAGIALAGAGILAFAAAITALVAVGTAGITILTAMLTAIITLIPDMVRAFAEGLLQLVDTIGNGAPRIVAAFVKITIALLDAVIKLSPKIADAFLALLQNVLKILVKAIPDIARAGYEIMIGLLSAIRDKIPDIVKVVAEIIIAFIKALAKHIPEIVDAGIKGMADFINGVADAIRNNGGEISGAVQNLTSAMFDLGKHVVEGFVKGLGDATGISSIFGAAKKIGNAAKDGVAGAIDSNSPAREFIKLGKYATQGFALGLRDTNDVQQSLDNMRDLLKSALDESTAEIEKQKQKIEELNSRTRTKANSAGIDKQLKAANEALLEAEKIQTRTTKAGRLYRNGLKDEQQKLLALSKQYEVVTDKLKAANEVLQNAIDERDSFAKSTTDAFDNLPDLSADTSLDTYFNGIRDATQANIKFKATLDQLKTIGLDDATYQKFLDTGVGIQGFLDSLLSAGPGAVKELGNIDAALASSAQAIGSKAAADLKQAAVDAAQGFVIGLEKQQANIAAAMDKIAQTLVDSIKARLQIKSPSKVFEDISKLSLDGLVRGFDKYGNMVKIAAVDVGDLAMTAMKNSLSQLNETLPQSMDLNPTIAPVLDLTQIQKTAAGLNDILAPRDVSVNVSYDQASVLALETAANKKAQDEFMEMALVQGDTFQYIQNNNSPKALSNAEIYRQTKNQLSIVKGALPK